MIARARSLGQAMEQLACDYLVGRGLELVARNFRTRRGELDLVMRERGAYVFVEVRYRSHSAYGGGVESVDHRKQQRLIAAAQQFLLEQEGSCERACRFDVVAISSPNGTPHLDWLKDAFGT